MKKLLKITRGNLNKNKLITLGYCQAQRVLSTLYDYKIGYNSGVYGWNYDLYRIDGYDIITGYNVPYGKYCDVDKKNKIIELENELINGEKINVREAIEKIFSEKEGTKNEKRYRKHS